MKIIHGRVDADGTPASEGDFEVERVANGRYKIRFAKGAFQSTPTVVVTQNHKSWDSFDFTQGNPRANAVITGIDRKKFTCVTGDGSGEILNRNFCFIAIGD